MLKNRLYFCLILIFFGIIFSILLSKFNHQSIEKKIINSLTPTERIYLENFFKFTVTLSTFGYTIFGDKPMSIETFLVEEEDGSILDSEITDEIVFNKKLLKRGWEVWQKKKKLFLLKGFSLIAYSPPDPPGKKFIEVALINHQAFLEAVRNNLEDFQTILEETISPETILEGYIKGREKYFEKIRSHEGLFGTLLGYGRNNAWEYYKSNFNQLKSFSDQDPENVKIIFLPMFAAIPNTDETNYLNKKYLKQRDEIEKLYQNKHFLITSLEALTNKN